MKKKWALVVGLLVLSLVLVACQPAGEEAPAPPPSTEVEETEQEVGEVAEEPLKVAALLPGVVTDNSWNQQAYEGLQKAEEECGVVTTYSEKVVQAEQMELVRNYALEGYDIIIGHGGEYNDAFKTIAPEFPDLQFVVINGVTGQDNIGSIKIDYYELGYVACSLACEMTETGKIGIVQGEPIPILLDSEAACRQVLASDHCEKDVELIVVATGSWDDVARAREASLAMIADGVDVLWQNLDAADAGVFSAAVDEGVYAIGQYVDTSSLGPSAYIGSPAGSPTTLVYEAACGHVPPGEIVFMDVNTPDGIGVIMSDLVPQEVQAKMRDVIEKMRSGEIEVVKTR